MPAKSPAVVKTPKKPIPGTGGGGSRKPVGGGSTSTDASTGNRSRKRRAVSGGSGDGRRRSSSGTATPRNHTGIVAGIALAVALIAIFMGVSNRSNITKVADAFNRFATVQVRVDSMQNEDIRKTWDKAAAAYALGDSAVKLNAATNRRIDDMKSEHDRKYAALRGEIRSVASSLDSLRDGTSANADPTTTTTTSGNVLLERVSKFEGFTDALKSFFSPDGIRKDVNELRVASAADRERIIALEQTTNTIRLELPNFKRKRGK